MRDHRFDVAVSRTNETVVPAGPRHQVSSSASAMPLQNAFGFQGIKFPVSKSLSRDGGAGDRVSETLVRGIEFSVQRMEFQVEGIEFPASEILC